jgi:DNA helicase-2/ATP-dependent DNA helicase PcrA
MRFFERTEIRDLVGYVHFSFNPNDTLSFETIINTPQRGVGNGLVEKVSTLSRAHGKTVLDILEGLCRQDLTLGYTLPEKVLASLRAFIQLCTQVKTMMDLQVRSVPKIVTKILILSLILSLSIYIYRHRWRLF